MQVNARILLNIKCWFYLPAQHKNVCLLGTADKPSECTEGPNIAKLADHVEPDGMPWRIHLKVKKNTRYVASLISVLADMATEGFQSPEWWRHVSVTMANTQNTFPYCQRFFRVHTALWFPKMFRWFPNISEDAWRLPKMFRWFPYTAEDVSRFPKMIRQFPNVAEDVWRLVEEWSDDFRTFLKMFEHISTIYERCLIY